MTENEIIIIAAFAVLLIAIIIIQQLTIRDIGERLHESISASNIAPIYDALLPIAKQYGELGAKHLADTLETRAKLTSNKIDDAFAKLVAERLRQMVEDADADTVTADAEDSTAA